MKLVTVGPSAGRRRTDRFDILRRPWRAAEGR